MDNLGLEAIMVMSNEGEMMWRAEDSKMFQLQSGKVMAFYNMEDTFDVMMSISRIRLTRNIRGDLRGMWWDSINKWWERFLRRDMMSFTMWENQLLVFYYVDKTERIKYKE
jgi:hypothetical protein